MDEVLDALDARPNVNAIDDGVRVALQRYATAERCTFNADEEGSIKIRRSGGDNDLSDIAIVFDMSGNSSRASQESALGVFKALCNEPLQAGVALVGYFSNLSHSSHSGTASEKPGDQKSVFETSHLETAVLSSHSAILEIQQTDQESLRLTGSPLLISRAKKHAKTSASLEVTAMSNLKTPYLQVHGPSAQQVAVDTIRDYSKYVAALFENFD